MITPISEEESFSHYNFCMELRNALYNYAPLNEEIWTHIIATITTMVSSISI